MNAAKLIAAEETATLAGDIASDLLAPGPKSLPSPKIIVGVLAFFGGLSWVASLGRQSARVASMVGAVVTLLFLMRPLVLAAFQNTSNTLIGFLSTGQACPQTSTQGA